MALDISSVQLSPKVVIETARQTAPSSQTQAAIAEVAREKSRAAMSDSAQATAIISNHRLSFSINSKLDEVVVKVIDSETDKVVREIPPVELQHVYERIREVAGLLFDRRA
jgi:flagellar protein FlaG